VSTDTNPIATDRVISRSVVHAYAVGTIVTIIAFEEAERNVHSATVRLCWVWSVSTNVAETHIKVTVDAIVTIRIPITATRDDRRLVAGILHNVTTVDRTSVSVVTVRSFEATPFNRLVNTFLFGQVARANRTRIPIVAIWIEVHVAFDALVVHTDLFSSTVRIIIITALLKGCIGSDTTLVADTYID
jgi:hypothetical protein